jgi:hypothetical protein
MEMVDFCARCEYHSAVFWGIMIQERHFGNPQKYLTLFDFLPIMTTFNFDLLQNLGALPQLECCNDGTLE